MKITQDLIEQKAMQYLQDNGHKPQFILMNTYTYDRFCDQFKSLDKDTNITKIPMICKIYCNKDIELDVLPVRGENDFFEIVG